MSKVYQHEVAATEDDLSPLAGCLLTDISDGAAEDGEEIVTLEFFNPSTYKYIRLAIGENSELYLSAFEEN